MLRCILLLTKQTTRQQLTHFIRCIVLISNISNTPINHETKYSFKTRKVDLLDVCINVEYVTNVFLSSKNITFLYFTALNTSTSYGSQSIKRNFDGLKDGSL